MKRALFVALWVVASIIATSMAIAAVGSVTNDVTDSPGATLATPDASTSSTSALDEAGTRTSTTHDGSPTTSTTDGPATTTTSSVPADDPDDGATTSTTIADDDDHEDGTTTEPVATETRTYQLDGGWVKVEIGPGIVRLVGASPSPGFSMEVDRSGGDGVRVRFDSDDHESELEVRWEDGELIVEIEEESEGDEPDDE